MPSTMASRRSSMASRARTAALSVAPARSAWWAWSRKVLMRGLLAVLDWDDECRPSGVRDAAELVDADDELLAVAAEGHDGAVAGQDEGWDSCPVCGELDAAVLVHRV